MARVAIYARVSTKDKGQNPEMQLSELREYCGRRGWKVTGEYVDVGVSGSKSSRPQLDRLMRDARLRRVDVIAVWKLPVWPIAAPPGGRTGRARSSQRGLREPKG